uniref:Uncharacterized protein n=1 Tax=Arundo donax TaxID=35708 RepID=A0A0A8XPB2_ARUDO
MDRQRSRSSGASGGVGFSEENGSRVVSEAAGGGVVVRVAGGRRGFRLAFVGTAPHDTPATLAWPLAAPVTKRVVVCW